ncbi:site-specific integrase, partial [Stutzerimonas nitrititolerans]
MQTVLDAYFQHLRSERQVSPHTLDGYRRDLLKVTDYCDRQQVRQWSELKAHHVRQLIADQHRRGLSSRSLARLLSSLRGLYRYLNQEGHCSHDPAAGLSAPKGEKRLPRLLDTDRAMQLLDGGIEDDFIGHRDQAMLELFYSSGLRLSELVGLDLDQLDLPAGLVQVQGKGNKARVLPVGRKAREALQAWLPLRALSNP